MGEQERKNRPPLSCYPYYTMHLVPYLLAKGTRHRGNATVWMKARIEPTTKA